MANNSNLELKDDWEDLPTKAVEVDDWETLETPSVSMTESALRGLAQGATLGFADEITGGLSALKDIALTDKTLADLPEVYKSNRDESRAEYSEASEANPKSSMVGNITGSIASSFIPGLNVAKGATLASAVGKTAALGGIAGLGSSSKDNLADQALDTLTGAAIGGAAGGIGAALGKGISKAAPVAGDITKKAGVKLGEVSDDLAADAVNMSKEALEYPTLGGALTDMGIIKPFQSPNQIVKSTIKNKDKIQSILDNSGITDFSVDDVIGKFQQKNVIDKNLTPGDAAAAAIPYLLSGSGPMAILGYLGKKGMEGRTASTASWAGNKLANIIQNTPDKLGRFKDVIQGAANRGPHALAVANFILSSNNPEYRKLIEDNEEEDTIK